MQKSTAREPWVDALRALAVLGVFIVNGMGYAFAPNSLAVYIGPPQPIDASLAYVLHGVVLTFVQGKAWPVLSFLFGYSLCSIALAARTRQLDYTRLLQKRYLKLLLIGLLHGIFLYFGDILTSYALCGFLIARRSLLKPNLLLKYWHKLSFLNAAIWLLLCLIAFVVSTFMENQTATVAMTAIIPVELDFASVTSIKEFFTLNCFSFIANTAWGTLFFIPLIMWLVTAGVLARRFKLLSKHSYATRFWKRHLGLWQLYCALFLNIIFAIYVNYEFASFGLAANFPKVAVLGQFAEIWLSAAILAWAMRYIHSTSTIPFWAIWLAPAGRHTLSMYLCLSAGLVLTNGAFLTITANTGVTLSALVAAWFIAVLLARKASAMSLRDPIARWLSR